MNLIKNNIKIKTINNRVIEKHPVPILGIDYKVKIVYKNIKTINVDIENRTIKISLPNKYKKEYSSNILDLAIEKLYEQVAFVEVERAMEITRIMLGIAPDEYEIKKIIKLGKCEDKKIIINPELVMYNRKIIDYVILHEFCHLKYKTHSKGFKEMIKKYEPKYEEYEDFLNS